MCGKEDRKKQKEKKVKCLEFQGERMEREDDQREISGDDSSHSVGTERLRSHSQTGTNDA